MLRLTSAIVIIIPNDMPSFFTLISGSYYLSQPSSSTRSCISGQFMTITYGRWHCHNGTATVTTRMNSNCNYNTQCTIVADNYWTGINPCLGISKTLYWTSTCSGQSWYRYQIWTMSLLILIRTKYSLLQKIKFDFWKHLQS